MQFLMGLNGSYAAIHGQILLMQPLPDTHQVYSLVLQQEKQVEVSLSNGNKNLYAMLADQDNKVTSAHQVQKQKTPLHCSYCDCDYHNIEKCYYFTWLSNWPQASCEEREASQSMSLKCKQCESGNK